MAKGVYERTDKMKTGKHMLGRHLTLACKKKISEVLKKMPKSVKTWGHNLRKAGE